MKSLIQFLHYLFLGNGFSLWYLVRPWSDWHERRGIVRNSLGKARHTDSQQTETVVCLFEGYNDAGGLADRLRGIVSVYKECRDAGLEFRLYFKHPFDLELFLQPAQYNWRITNKQICRDKNKVNVLVMRPLSDSSYTLQRQKHWMHTTFRHLARTHFTQVHIYTNTPIAYGKDFPLLFSELFCPTPRLAEALGAIQRQIGARYISVSMRFLSLLGDFEDVVDVQEHLTEAERQKLIGDCIKTIGELHMSYPGHKILLNSDSTRMLQAAKELQYVYCIPGNITHLDRCDHATDSYKQFEKTFLDFFTISRADEVFIIRRHPKMRSSGFPYAAAMIGGKTLKHV